MKKKRKAMALWKVILITISSIIGLIGVTVLALYLRGDFSDNPVYPESGIFFVLDGNEKYNSDLQVLETSESFSLTLSTSTEDVNRRTVNLSLPTGTHATVRENGYLDNGIIRVPETVQLDSAFTVELSTSPIDNYLTGGITSITATSTYPTIDPQTVYINVDVPVESIDAFCYDAEDATEEELNDIFVGSYFKVGVNYLPERSEKVFGREETKYVFYNFTTNNIEFDYITKTFHATSVSEGANDEISVFVFSNSEFEKAFLSEFNGNPNEFTTQEEYSEFNSAALNYMSSHSGSYKLASVDNITVKEVSVNSFVVSNESFNAKVDKQFNLALNSTLPEFDGNLGVVIRDEEDNILNSVYAGGVGIALSSKNENNARILLSGGEVLKVTIDAVGDYNETNGTYSYEYSYDTEGNLEGVEITRMTASDVALLDSFEPILPVVTTDGQEVEVTYYFFLPSRNVGGVAGNYNYSLSSDITTSADFLVALFLEGEGNYQLFLAENQKMETLSHITITFENSVESDISWKEGTDILRIIYDSDSMLSDSIELSELINLPTENVYQTTRYFLMFEHGEAMPDGFNAIALGNGYTYTNGVDFNITVPGGAPDGGSNIVNLYELSSTNLSALEGYDSTLYLVFATVRTNADGELTDGNGNILTDGARYKIMMISDIKSLEIEATIPLEDIASSLSLTSSVNEIYLDNNQILLPSVLAEEETFRFNISIDEERLEQLRNLYSAGDLRIEFRQTANGEVVDFIVASSDITISDTSFSGDIVVYEDFNNIEGISLTPYLVYNNGKRVQEKEITIDYGGARNSFTLYKQSVADAEYSFMTNLAEGATLPTTEQTPINVVFNLTTRTITWPGETNAIELEELNNRLSVILYDTKGKVIRTNVASYNLTEVPVSGDRVITIINNAISQFLSTDGKIITTTVQASYRNAGMTDSATLEPIYFTVQSEGVSKIEYDNTNGITPPTEYPTLSPDAGGTIKIEKYLVDDNFINMNSLVRVYRKDETNADVLVNIRFTLNRADMTGFDSSDLESLFLVSGEPTDNGISNGIIKLGNENAYETNTIDNNLVTSYTDPIYSFKMISALARDVRLVFDITDDSGLVNLKLELTLKKNLDYSPLLETYANEKGYSDYLLYGDSDEIRVFGAEGMDENDPFSLDRYLPVFNIRNGQNEATWSGNLYISSPTGVIVGTGNDPTLSQQGANISFKDVTKKETGDVTFYYKGYNPYGLSITVTFVLSPNYAYVQHDDYIDLYSLIDADEALDAHYELCRATDLIDYIRGGSMGDLPVLETAPLFTYQPEENSLIELLGGNITRTTESFTSTLGATVSNDVSLVSNSETINEEAFALMFKLVDGAYALVDSENKFVSSLPFRVGYGELGINGVNSLLGSIINDTSSDYSVLATSDGYELVLLENGTYNLGALWTYEYQGLGIQNNGDSKSIKVQALTNFNISGTLTFTNTTGNSIDKIIVQTRLTRIGLEYVVYSENYDNDDEIYPYDIITGTMNDLFENNIKEDIEAGQDVLQVLYFNASDEDLTKKPGFHLISSDNTSYTTYNLSIEQVTEGYENLITIASTGSYPDINDAIKLNSMIDIDKDVFAVLKLTLTMSISGGQQLSTDIYYRIRITPNYSFDGDVTYPYNGTAEYVTSFTDSEEGTRFIVDFEEKFTSQNASLSVVGKTRFPDVKDNENNKIDSLNYIYTIYSVTVNDEELSNYSAYISFNLERNEIPEGKLVGTLTELGRNAIIEVKVARTAENVANSEKVYTLILNNSPSYDATVVNSDNSEELEEDENGNFNDDITIGKDYRYSITLLQNEGDIQTPVVSGVNAHITSVGGEKYLKPFLRETSDDNLIYAYTSNGTPQSILDTSAFIDMTVEDLTEDKEVTGATLSKDEYKLVTTTVDTSYYIKNEDIRYFTFTQSDSQYELTFTTVASIEEDASFSIGIYTEYANIFDIFFNLDGGYEIVYRDLSVDFASGNDYNISSFIESVTLKADSSSVDINSEIEYVVTSITTASNIEYTESSEGFVASDFIKIVNEDTLGKVFRVAGFNEDFTATITATTDDGYSFKFDIKFKKSFDNSVIEKDSTLEIYAQDSNVLNVKEGDIYDALSVFEERKYLNNGTEGASLSESLDEFTFSNGNTEYEFTAENVAEIENFVLDLTLSYSFGDKVMFTFTIEYSYTVLPNVDLSFNYPNPENLEKTTFTSEYVDNNETIDNYFNSVPKFSDSETTISNSEDYRVHIGKLGGGSDYYYDIAIYVDEINNAVLTVNNTTTISSAGLVGSVTNRTGEMPNYSFKFSLNNLSQVGTITFSIVVNEVTDYYYVTINNNNNVTVETNATNLVENEYERIYVEDIAGSTDSYLYSLDRMLKYEFSGGASGSYYLRFENGVENFVHEVVVEDTGIVVVEDLGRSYTGFSLQGVYSSEEDAENSINAITDTSSIFLINPYLTNRIVLKYAGHVVSKDVANIYLQDKTGTKQMENVEINEDLNEAQTFNILYQYSYNTSAQYSTNSTYTTMLSVKFDVTSSVQNHYEEIITGQQVSLLSLTNFGILNTETGEAYTPSDIQANNAYLTLQIYGFSDNEIVVGSELYTLHDNLISGTALVAQGQRFETGLNPRYGMTLNTTSGDITSNYLTLTTVGSAQRPNDYIIYAQGAGNIGNFVAMKLTYTTTVAGNSYSESADLLFKVLPAYQVEFTAESASGGTVYGNDMMIGDKNYSTNSSSNPFNITNDDTTYYLYSSSNPVLRVYRTNGSGMVTNSTNLSNRFTYTFRVNAENGYNTYETASPRQGLSLSWSRRSDALGSYYETNTELSSPATSISFTANSINIGARYYYIDAVDNFGFNIRFYFVIRAEINPVVQEVNTYDVNEGDAIQIGAQYRTVTMQQGTAIADEGETSSEFAYYFAYDLQNVNINNIAPQISGLNSSDYTLSYYYVDREGVSHLTTQYSEVNSESANNSATLYLNTSSVSANKIFRVTYNGSILSPLHSDSEYNAPNFNVDRNGLNVTLSGFEAYAFNKPESEVAIPYIEGHSIFGTHTSNVNDVEIASISFEYNGKTVATLSGSSYFNSEQSTGGTNKIGSNKLITAENYMINNAGTGLITGYSAIATESNNEEKLFKIPTLPGYLYGTSTVVDGVTMVIRLERENSSSDYAELRINLNVSRSQKTSLTKTNYLDTEEINGSAFTTDGTAYNDTLEIELGPNTEVAYAISTESTAPTSSEFITLSNNRNYTHVEYVRISTIGTENAKGKTYYVYLDSEKPDGVTFRYGSSTLSFDASNKANISLGTITNNPITLRIESASELNSQNYTTRNFYTIINENGQDYHNNHSVRLYTLANSITTSAEYGVSNYYSVSGGTGSDAYTYYVISASSWASDLTYSSGNEGGSLTNSYPISIRPYYYSYSISTDGGSARGASVDKMGTITTGTSFNIQTNYIEVDITLHVAGADGLFEDEIGIELGTVRFHLNVSAGRGMGLNNATGIYALGGNALVTLNGNTVQAFGSASTSNSPITPSSTRTIVVPAGEKIDFDDYFSPTSGSRNSSYRIVKASADSSYNNWNNEDGYTYSNSGVFDSIYVESYVSGTSINYRGINVTVIAYNKNNVDHKALAVEVGGGENKTLGALLGGTVYLAEDVDAGIFGSALLNGAEVTDTILASTTSKVETINVISVIDDTVNYYEVTLLFYSSTESYNVALTSRTNYDLYTLFEGASSVYAISDDNKLVDMQNESLIETANETTDRTYYVVDAEGNVSENTVTYYIYNSTENTDIIYWYHGEVTREKVIASMLGDEYSEGTSYDEANYTLYQLSSNNMMTKVDVSDNIEMGELNNNRANINFLLVTNIDGVISYKYYIFTFYYYTDSATFDVATSYSSGYALSNLNDLVTSHFNLSMIGSASWYVFENGDIISQPVVELTASMAHDGVITRDFYVNINNTYYSIEVNFYCSLRTYNDTMTTSNDEISVNTLQEQFNEVLGTNGVTVTQSGTIYEISDDNSITPLTSITLPSDETSAVNSRLLYRITVDGTITNYIFNLTILKDEGSLNIDTDNVFNLNSSTLGSSGEISLVLSSVRAEIASKLNILQRNLVLSTGDGVNIVTYSFTPLEPIINYDYFFIKLIAQDSSNPDFKATIYILANNTINIRTNNLTIIINNFSGTAISADTLKEKINAGLGLTDVVSSKLYLIENDRANGELGELSVASTTFVTRGEFYYEAQNSAGIITRAIISATIVGYPSADIIGEDSIVNVDYSVVNESGTLALSFDKAILHSRLSAKIGTTVDGVTGLTSVGDNYQVEISGDGDYAFMVKALVNSMTGTPEERNVIILAFNVEVAG